MSENMEGMTCVVIGASHAGVNFAFSLRKEGWTGKIILVDGDRTLPYHRPPLSKAYLTDDLPIEKYSLKSPESYEKENISLLLGVKATRIDRADRTITLDNGEVQSYDKLVIATGARPFIPPIQGIESNEHVFVLRTAEDVATIQQAVKQKPEGKAVIIGGGYIGLEIAASLRKSGMAVTILEREDRVLARVTCPEMSSFFQKLHHAHDVEIHTGKTVTAVQSEDGNASQLICSDGSQYKADVIVLGAGIIVNTELAKEAGLTVENGIKVDGAARTSDQNIYAIGDCSYHYNPRFDRFVRLESVQNAVDQAKVVAADICGKPANYDTIPWFWSDQYDIKLQMVGLSTGYNDLQIRQEDDEGKKFSLWYFKDEELIAVDAVNNAKAYVIGTKFIKERVAIDKAKLIDSTIPLKPKELIASESVS